MSDNLTPIGFWSYARQDDEEKLSGLRTILQRQLQQKYGREPIKIFQDVAAIPPGADWNLKITEALNSSTFFIPIITPNFLESEWCNQEFFVFLKREQAIAKQFPELAASRRVFPIFYIDITDVEAFNSHLIPELRKRQWTNFRDLIYKDEKHEDVRMRLDQIAESIVKVLRLDQRTVRERKNAAAAAEALEIQAAEQRQAEEEARALQQARDEAPRLAREAEERRLREVAERQTQELAAQRIREEEALQAELYARENTERKAREAEAAAKLRTEQQAREIEVQARHEAEQKARAEAAQTAHEEVEQRSQPTNVPFWKTAPAIIAAALIAIVTVGVCFWAFSSEAHPPSAVQQPSTPANAPPASPSAYDQARTFLAASNYAQAVPLLTQACQSGTAEACVELGTLYQKGLFVPADVSKAAQLFQQACTAGDQNGCTQLKVLQAALAALNGS